MIILQGRDYYYFAGGWLNPFSKAIELVKVAELRFEVGSVFFFF